MTARAGLDAGSWSALEPHFTALREDELTADAVPEADPDAAGRACRGALAPGNTRPLPELYQAAGAGLPFDRAIVRDVARTFAAHLEATPPLS